MALVTKNINSIEWGFHISSIYLSLSIPLRTAIMIIVVVASKRIVHGEEIVPDDSITINDDDVE